jgi:hypothetical protein
MTGQPPKVKSDMPPSRKRRLLGIALLLFLHLAAAVGFLVLGDSWWSGDGLFIAAVAITTAQVALGAVFASLAAAPSILRWAGVAVVISLLTLIWGADDAEFARDCGAILVIEALVVLMPLWSLREVGLRLTGRQRADRAVGRPRWQFSLAFALAWMVAVAVLLLAAKVLHGSYTKQTGEWLSVHRDVLRLGIGMALMASVQTLMTIGVGLGAGRRFWPGLVAAIGIALSWLIPLAFSPDSEILGLSALALTVGDILLLSFLILRFSGYHVAWVRKADNQRPDTASTNAGERIEAEILASSPDGT